MAGVTGEGCVGGGTACEVVGVDVLSSGLARLCFDSAQLGSAWVGWARLGSVHLGWARHSASFVPPGCHPSELPAHNPAT